LPGGLGVREASMVFLMNTFGVPVVEATIATVSVRVVTTVYLLD